jgi:DNA-directed RNA polymerase specialized sigma24 family protein
MVRRESAVAPGFRTMAEGLLPAGSRAVNEPATPPAQVYPDETIRVAYAEIAKSCRCAGLSPADAEDLAQDIWLWIIRGEVQLTAVAIPWLRAVVRNYILRFRRWTYKHRTREGQSLETVQEPASWQPAAPTESNELLDLMASLLPKRERSLLALIRRGYSLPEASRRLGIPPGSWAYYHGRLLDCARRVLKRPLKRPRHPRQPTPESQIQRPD